MSEITEKNRKEVRGEDQIQEKGKRLSGQNTEMNIYKILQNKRKVDIQCSTVDNEQEYAIITLSDITSVKKHEKEKQRILFQEIYFHSMAHDVRTPLTSIMVANENLKLMLTDP